MMIGIEVLNVVVDASGSFCEFGKQHMLDYLGNTVMNAENMPWARAQFNFCIWREEIVAVESLEKIPAEGVTNVEALIRFLLERKDNEAVLLITDGDFKGADKRPLKNAAETLGNRFAVAAAGFDASILRLHSMTPNCFAAEDMLTAIKILAS